MQFIVAKNLVHKWLVFTGCYLNYVDQIVKPIIFRIKRIITVYQSTSNNLDPNHLAINLSLVSSTNLEDAVQPSSGDAVAQETQKPIRTIFDEEENFESDIGMANKDRDPKSSGLVNSDTRTPIAIDDFVDYDSSDHSNSNLNRDKDESELDVARIPMR